MARKQGRKNLLDLINEAPTWSSGLLLTFTEPFTQSKTKNIVSLLEELPQYKDSVLNMNSQELIYVHKSLQNILSDLEEVQSLVDTQLRRKKKICPHQKINFQENLLVNLIKLFICSPCSSTIYIKKKLRYDLSIENCLYPCDILDRVKSIEGYTIFSVRLRSDNMIECLVCNYKISLTKIDHLWDHVCDLFHMGQLDFHQYGLLKYHEFWMEQSSHNQDIQLMYQYFTDTSMKCIKCKKVFPYEEVFSHKQSCKGKYPKGRTLEETIAKPPQTIDYCREVKETLFHTLPHLEIDGIEYPIMQQIKKIILCMICNKKVRGLISNHCNSDVHLLNQSYWTYTQTLKGYHNVWSSLPGNEQMQQIHFRMQESNMTCIACNCCIGYDSSEVQEHMNSTNHVQNVKSITPLGVKQDVEEVHNSDLPAIEMDGIWYPVMELVDDTIYCLICSKFVDENYTEHTRLGDHIRMQADECHQFILKKYHNVFISLSEAVKSERMFFQKHNTDILCTLCDKDLPCNVGAVRQHINSSNHAKKVAKAKGARMPPKIIALEALKDENFPPIVNLNTATSAASKKKIRNDFITSVCSSLGDITSILNNVDKVELKTTKKKQGMMKMNV